MGGLGTKEHKGNQLSYSSSPVPSGPLYQPTTVEDSRIPSWFFSSLT